MVVTHSNMLYLHHLHHCLSVVSSILQRLLMLVGHILLLTHWFILTNTHTHRYIHDGIYNRSILAPLVFVLPLVTFYHTNRKLCNFGKNTFQNRIFLFSVVWKILLVACIHSSVICVDSYPQLTNSLTNNIFSES